MSKCLPLRLAACSSVSPSLISNETQREGTQTCIVSALHGLLSSHIPSRNIPKVLQIHVKFDNNILNPKIALLHGLVPYILLYKNSLLRAKNKMIFVPYKKTISQQSFKILISHTQTR